MDHAFDALAKAIAESGSRRDMLKRLGATTLAIALGSMGVSCEPDQTTGPRPALPLFDSRGRCKKINQKCREDSECCSAFCDPFTGICTCPSGTVVCPASGQCIPACQPPFVLNGDTCQCECPTNSFTCGGVTCCVTGTTCCGSSCVNLSSDNQNCGVCGNTCTAPNATSTCVNGTCQFVACNPGFADCDGMPSNGCEANLQNDVRNCGACGHTCTAPNAVSFCAMGTCQIQFCNMGFGNCDGNPLTGCETNLLNDVHNCGMCGRTCMGQNATMFCMGGTCLIASCNPGFGNCNGNPADGCETSLNTVFNCGACGVVCAMGQSCVGGVCV